MALALNNLKRVDMPLNKETKPNQTNSTAWIYHMDANETYGEKAWRELHKDSASSIEWIQEAISHETTSVRPPTSYLKNHKKRKSMYAGHYWRSEDELISDVFLWTPSHGHARVGRPVRTYIQQLCMDTGRSLEDLPGAKDDRKEW